MCSIEFNAITTSMVKPQIAIPKELAGWIVMNVEFRQLICKPCEEAIPPHGLDGHLRNKHGAKGNAIVRNFVKKWASVDKRDQTIPDDGLAPQPHIRVFQRTRCRQCPFISHTARDMEDHWAWTSHTELIMGPAQAWYGESDANSWTVVAKQYDFVDDDDEQEELEMMRPLSTGLILNGSWHEDPKDLRIYQRPVVEKVQRDVEEEAVQVDVWPIESMPVVVGPSEYAFREEDEYVII
jgi:hypothetical protein